MQGEVRVKKSRVIETEKRTHQTCTPLLVLVTSTLLLVQWNLSIVDTTGTLLAVLYREVFLTQRQQLYVVGTADSVLNREMSFSQSVRYREVPLYL